MTKNCPNFFVDSDPRVFGNKGLVDPDPYPDRAKMLDLYPD
jgi:hypothetical protein